MPQAAYIQARGLWAPYFKGIGYGNNGPQSDMGYIGMSMCWEASSGNAKARQFLSDIMARRWNSIGEHYKGRAANGFWHLYHYGQVVGLFNERVPGQIVSPMIGNVLQWAIVMQTFYNPPGYSGSAITWAAEFTWRARLLHRHTWSGIRSVKRRYLTLPISPSARPGIHQR